MKTNFNFNSHVCTDRNQSERLLALGLKPETADMCWQTTTFNGEPITYPSQDVWLNGSIITNNHFPAWSLHRLIEMMPPDRKYEWLTISKNDVFYRCIHFGEEDFIGPDYCGDNLYDSFVIMYEWLIKEGYFNKEYLEE